MGHVFVPFGLRRDINTTGTLRQLITGPNLGTKVDYGVSFHGQNRWLSYETGVYRGSGLEYHDEDNPYLFSGRIATGSSNPWIIGLSGLHGKIKTPKGVIERTRFGADAQVFAGWADFLAEVSYGMDPKDTEVLNSIVEISRPFVDETLLAYVQGIALMKTMDDEWKNQTRGNVGLRWSATNALSVESEYEHSFTGFGPKVPTSEFRLQLRYRVN